MVFNAIHELLNITGTTRNDQRRMFDINMDLLSMGLKFKNNSFSEENEIRLIHGNSEVAAEPDMFKFRFTDDNIISYIEIPLYSSEVDSNVRAIKEVIIGPKSKITIKELESYFHYAGKSASHGVVVSKSKSSYR